MWFYVILGIQYYSPASGVIDKSFFFCSLFALHIFLHIHKPKLFAKTTHAIGIAIRKITPPATLVAMSTPSLIPPVVLSSSSGVRLLASHAAIRSPNCSISSRVTSTPFDLNSFWMSSTLSNCIIF